MSQDEAASILSFLKSQEHKSIGQDLEAYREKVTLLNECKAKGFPDLIKSGLIAHAAPRAKVVYKSRKFRDATGADKRDAAKAAYELIKQGHELKAAAADVGTTSGSIAKWMEQYTDYKRPVIAVKESEVKRFISLINDGDHCFNSALREIGRSYCGMKRAIEARGLKYDVKTMTIKPI